MNIHEILTKEQIQHNFSLLNVYIKIVSLAESHCVARDISQYVGKNPETSVAAQASKNGTTVPLPGKKSSE